MKKYAILFCCVIIASLLLGGCEKWMSDHLGRADLHFENSADYKISLYSIVIIPRINLDTIIYPDTSLPYHKPTTLMDIDAHQWVEVPVGGHIKWEDIYEHFGTDTISYFIFATDSLNMLGWDRIRESYNIVQRYDIGYCDLGTFGDMSFPPSEEMRNIKMWPPYGTYDVNGHRVK